MFSIYWFNLILFLLVAQQSITTCDLSIFPEGFQPDDTIRAVIESFLFGN